jgi:ring-1,2-phenylacetyl-CoA epoxidase subunit PaaE
MKQYTVTVLHITEQPNDVKTFELSKPDGFYQVPGQFISIELTIGNRQVRRAYSLHNSPMLNEPLSFSVKRIDNGEVSRFLHDTIQVGDSIIVLQPSGLFTYQPSIHQQNNLLLLAAGTGITPIFSILKSALTVESHTTVTLIYSNHSLEQTLFYEELEQWKLAYPNRLHIIYFWSNSKNLLKARLNRASLEELVLQYAPVTPNTYCYTCGPADYMLLCRIVLLTLGFAEEQLFKETFVLPEDEGDDDDESLQTQTTTEIKTCSVEVRLANGSIHHLSIPSNQTILSALLAHKIEYPYSCQTGICSTCTANLVSGTVRMQRNEVLTDQEVNNGRVLLCTALPVSDQVVIEQ